jgi:hypothetical protein
LPMDNEMEVMQNEWCKNKRHNCTTFFSIF